MLFNKEEFNKCNVEDTSYKGCLKCLAYKTCRTPYLPAQGANKKGIYILLSAPTKGDDIKDLNGSYFNKIKTTFKDTLGIDVMADCVISHAVRCRIDGEVTASHIDNCRQYVFKEIKKHKPKLIYAVGATAMQVLFGEVWKGGVTNNIDKFISYTIPHLELKAWVTPIHTAEFVAQKEDEYQPQALTLWKKCIVDGYNYIGKRLPIADHLDKIKIIKNESELQWVLERWLLDNPKYVAFDYETTGIKPYNKGHHISTAAFSDEYYSYAFPKPQQKETLELLQKVLTHKRIGKIAHNMPFEDMWTYVDLNTQITPWVLDTCLSTHLLDNRQGVSGLKFQVFVNFGVGDYSSHIESYLKGQPKKERFNEDSKWSNYTHANSINMVDSIDIDDNLTYCALDAYFTYKLAMLHIPRLKSAEMPRVATKKLYGYDLYHKGALAYRKMSHNGLRIDREILAKRIEDTKAEQEILKAEVLNQPLFKEWKEWQGGSFNIDSGMQLGKFLFEYKKIPCKDFTDKGGYAVDSEALEKLNIPELKEFIKYKKLEKTIGTYLKPFWFEANEDDILRPLFSLNNVVSGRSACVAKGTKITVPSTDFMTHTKNIEDIQEGDYVYCFDDNLKPTLKKVVWVGKTGHKKVIRVHFAHTSRKDVGYIDLTPEHKVRIADGTYVQAKDLLNKEYKKRNKGVSVLAISIDKRGRVYATHNKPLLEHRFCYTEYNKKQLDSKWSIHHIDRNHFNNTKENLQLCYSNAEHVRLHYKDTIGNPGVRAKNIEKIKNLHKEGHYSHIYKKGIENPHYLSLSKEECEELLHKAKGHPTKCGYDYETFMRECNKNNIDIKEISNLYNSDGVFLSEDLVFSTVKKNGLSKSQKILKVGYARLLSLLQNYNITYHRGWANQNGHNGPHSVIRNNHQVIKIEHLENTVDVYDMEVEGEHNYIANGICVHNCNSPNLQNIPKNNDLMKELIRSVLFPHKGQLLAEVDFSNLEVYIGCCYHKDQQMLTYLEDNTADMHRDLATVLWLTTRKDMTKDESIALWDKLGIKALRNATKGVLSFPIQYGSYYKEMAKDGWEVIPKFTLKDGTPLKEHLASMGIKSYTDFENHMKTVEDWYWGDLFGSYGAWKKKHYKTYQKNGYMENKMGFKYSGYIKRNQAGNFPIQGSASNVLMYSIIKLQQWLEQGPMKSKIVGQIHDSILLSLEPNEVWEVLDMARYIMTKMTKEQYPWIDVQLRAEADIGEVDGSWYTVKEMSWDDIRRKFGERT